MNYLKFISYLYLAAAAAFLYDAISRLQSGEDAVISFIFVGIALFMFFFRRRYATKFRNNKTNKKL